MYKDIDNSTKALIFVRSIRRTQKNKRHEHRKNEQSRVDGRYFD